MDCAQKEKEIREKYPQKFSHPEIRPGGIWLGDQIVELAMANEMVYRANGLPSIRLGNPSLRKREGCGDFEFDHRPMFANLQEVMALEEKYKLEKQQGQEEPTLS